MPLQTAYTLYQPAGLPGFLANMEEWNGSTKIASATIAFGAPVQRTGDKGSSPLAAGGEYIGVAIGHHAITATNGDSYGQYDNVPVADEGVLYALADAAIAAGAAVRWNTATSRYTTAAASGTVIDVPGAEADIAAAGAGSLFKIRLRRVPG